MKVFIVTAEEYRGWDGSVTHILGAYTTVEKAIERFKKSSKYGKIGWEFDYEEVELDDLTD